MIGGRILLKLKLPKKMMIAGENNDSGPSGSTPSMVDLTKYLKPRAAKTRTMRSQIIPPPLVDFPVVSSCEQKNNSYSTRASILEEKMEDVLGFSDNSGNLKRKLEETDQNGLGRDSKSQKTDSAVDYPKISGTEGGDHHHDGEIRESEMININNSDERSLITKSSCTDESVDIKNQVTSSVGENDAPLAPKTPKIYSCNLCSKTFSSHLALGGHKSSHNKFKMVIYDAIDGRTRKESVTMADRRKNSSVVAYKNASSKENIAASPESVGDDRRHTCKICFKKFSSGQALGGHQRQHWTGHVRDQKTQYARKILDSDLNELPKEQDEDPSTSK